MKKVSKTSLIKGLIFNSFEHLFEENCPISAVNASHFLPYDFHRSNKLNLGNIAKWQK